LGIMGNRNSGRGTKAKMTGIGAKESARGRIGGITRDCGEVKGARSLGGRASAGDEPGSKASNSSRRSETQQLTERRREPHRSSGKLPEGGDNRKGIGHKGRKRTFSKRSGQAAQRKKKQGKKGTAHRGGKAGRRKPLKDAAANS